MQRQDITFRIVVKDPELKQAYIDNLANYKYGDMGIDLIVPKDYKLYIGSTSNKIFHNIQVGAYHIYNDGTEEEVNYDLRPRSGTGANTRLRVSNTPGSIDHYRGDVVALIDVLQSITEYPKELKHVDLDTGKEYVLVIKGTRLVQMVNKLPFGCKVEFVDELPPTQRGNKGFGSSGGI